MFGFPKILLLSVFIILLGTDKPKSNVPDADLHLFKLINTIDYSRGYSFELLCRERMGNRYTKGNSFVKVRKKPYAIYLRVVNGGQEVLWNEGGTTALVNPNGFPYINLNLDPYGSVLMEDQHHTLFDVGFDYFKSALLKERNKDPERFKKNFSYLGNVTCNGVDCYLLIYEVPDFGYRVYTPDKDESTFGLASKLNLNEYLIRSNNSSIISFRLKKDIRYLIPKDYAKKLILYIERATNTPVMISIYDDKGLLEEYQYSKVKLNPEFAPNEFSSSFKAYGF